MQSQYGGRVCDDWTNQAAACTAAVRPTDRPTDLIFRIHRIAWELGTGYVRSRLPVHERAGTFRALLPQALFARPRRVSLVYFLRIPWPLRESRNSMNSLDPCLFLVIIKLMMILLVLSFFFFLTFVTIFFNNITRFYNIEIRIGSDRTKFKISYFILYKALIVNHFALQAPISQFIEWLWINKANYRNK